MSEGDEKKMLQSAIEKGDIGKLEVIQNIITKTGAIEYTTKKAINFSNKAIESISNLKNSVYKETLISIAHFSVDRNL
jgi:Geranylgeranyl pyrophosphate synthase